MNKVLGMNIINKFAESLGMPIVKLAQIEYLQDVSLCLCCRKPVSDSRVRSVVLHCNGLKSAFALSLTGCSDPKSFGDYTLSGSLQRNLARTLLLRETR